MKEDTVENVKQRAMHFSLAQDNVTMPPVAVNVVLAVHRSLCRNFHACIFVLLIPCLTVSVDPAPHCLELVKPNVSFFSEVPDKAPGKRILAHLLLALQMRLVTTTSTSFVVLCDRFRVLTAGICVYYCMYYR